MLFNLIQSKPNFNRNEDYINWPLRRRYFLDIIMAKYVKLVQKK